MRRARHVVQQRRRAAPSCARTRRCRTACRSRPPRRRGARASCGLVDHRGSRPSASARASRLGTMMRVAVVGQHVEQAVGVGRDDRLPHRQRLEHGQRRALPQRRERRSGRRPTPRARRPSRTRRRRSGRPSPSARACASSGSSSGPSPTRKNFACGRSSTTSRAASTRNWLPFESCSRVTVPIANSPGAMPELGARRGDLVRGARCTAELLERHAEVDDLRLPRRDLARVDARSPPCSATRRSRCR